MACEEYTLSVQQMLIPIEITKDLHATFPKSPCARSSTRGRGSPVYVDDPRPGVEDPQSTSYCTLVMVHPL